MVASIEATILKKNLYEIQKNNFSNIVCNVFIGSMLLAKY